MAEREVNNESIDPAYRTPANNQVFSLAAAPGRYPWRVGNTALAEAITVTTSA